MQTIIRLRQNPVQRRQIHAAIGGGTFEMRNELPETRVQLKIPKVADGDNPALGAGVSLECKNLFNPYKFQMWTQFLQAHAGGLDGAGVIFKDAPEVFSGQLQDLFAAFFRET